jgi:methionyl aminopeptidase
VIVCKSAAELEKMRAANQLVARVLEALRRWWVPGATTASIDAEAERPRPRRRRRAGFKGYRGSRRRSARRSTTRSCTASRARACCARETSSRSTWASSWRFYGDCAGDAAGGRIAADAERLLVVTQDALARGIAQVRVGGRVSDIGHAVQAHVEAHGYSVVREFVGHGIGAALHEEPQVPNYGPAGAGRGWRRAWCWPSSRWSTWASRR